MTRARRFILAGFAVLSLFSSVVASFAQVPAPVPALPDTERRTGYSISASTCSCAVGFQLFGDSTDVGNWIEVFVVTGRVLTAPPGETITTLPTAAQRAGALLTFDGGGNPVATAPGVGTGNIVGPVSSTNGDLACFNGITGALLKDCGTIGNTTLTGDITGGPAIGTIATTLATVNANVGTWGSNSALPTITVDGKGRITAISNTTITPANIGAVPNTLQILGGAGMTSGGPLNADLTFGLANIPAGTILGNNTGISASPGDLTPSQVLDILGSTQGQILYRNATNWVVLSPGTNGQLLTSGGAGANPSWSTASGTGTVTSVAAGTGITASPSPIVGAGTISLTAPVTSALGGTGVVSPATHTIPINQGASAQVNTGTGTTGQALISQGASADPAFIGGSRVLLATLTASNSATLSDTTHITSTYNDYEIVFENIIPATNAVSCEIQIHSGGTFQTTTYLANALQFTGGGVSSTAQTTFIPCGPSGGLGNNAGVGISGTFRIYNPSLTSGAKHVTGQFSLVNGSANEGVIITGWWNGGVGSVDGFQVLMSSGNITSGTIKIYGML
jgi:hypothetical protein